MLPSPEDKRMRAAGVTIDAPSLPSERLTPEGICAFIVARLRYDFISGKDTVNAYVDQTQQRDSPAKDQAAYISASYLSERENEVLRILKDRTSPHFIDVSDPMLVKFFCRVVIKSHYHGHYRISVSSSVVDHTTALAA
jgi:hypothetical protein